MQRMQRVNFRLTEEQMSYLESRVRPGGTVSDVMRDVIDMARGERDSVETQLKAIKELLQLIRDPQTPPH